MKKYISYFVLLLVVLIGIFGCGKRSMAKKVLKK